MVVFLLHFKSTNNASAASSHDHRRRLAADHWESSFVRFEIDAEHWPACATHSLIRSKDDFWLGVPSLSMLLPALLQTTAEARSLRAS